MLHICIGYNLFPNTNTFIAPGINFITRTHYNLAIANDRLRSSLLFYSLLEVNTAAIAIDCVAVHRVCVCMWHAQRSAGIIRESINIKWHWGKMCEWNCKIHEPNILNLSCPRLRCVCLNQQKRDRIKLSACHHHDPKMWVYIGRNCSRQFMSCIQRILYAHLNKMFAIVEFNHIHAVNTAS